MLFKNQNQESSEKKYLGSLPAQQTNEYNNPMAKYTQAFKSAYDNAYNAC